jgi:N-acetyl-beta-hexosaminidase
MASLMTIIAIWDLRADDIRLRRTEPGIRLELGSDVNITAGHVPSKAAAEAAAMRRLEQLAGELAAELEARATAGAEEAAYIAEHGSEDLDTGHLRDPEGDEAAHG